MTRALMTGITGLRTHQQQLDVVANNLANMNTVGYKAQTTTFSDLMYNSVRGGSGPNDSNGGVNPQAIGSGVQTAQIAKRFTQGTLQSTGETLDFAIQGEGFFTLEGQSGENVFTRAGSFAVDASGRLVDPATGARVQRFGTTGEPATGRVGFQSPGDNSIVVPLGAPVAGEATRDLDFKGNLPSDAKPPTAEILSSFTGFSTTTGPADASTLLDDLLMNQTDYVAGDVIELDGTNPDGTPFSGTFAAENATMGDLVNELNSIMTGATASLGSDGTLTVTADDTGEAFLSLVIKDASANVGSSNFFANSLVVTTEGNDGDTFELSTEIYDPRGANHRISFEFQKTSTNTWDVVADINADSGTLLDATVLNVTFNEDGTFALVGADGSDDANIDIQFSSIDSPQTIALDFQQLNHLATEFSLSQDQNGYPPGTLVSVAMSSTGELGGLASNGRTIPLAQLAMATFSNVKGLDALGGNFYQETMNSGVASIGEGLSGTRGQVIAGQLESSNVDIAQEFTQLIVAQRGFSANARTITVANELLEELTNIIR
ncbi:MAG: flagellar hook-basal body complex protein [Pirellulaceae bacterium]|nr:flagellar hook-basal body complex protein [Pirellulaceae bacterium]